MNIPFERQRRGRAGLVDYGSFWSRHKRKWQADMQYLEQCLEQQPRTYNSKFSNKARTRTASELEYDRRIQKRALKWKRTRHSHQAKLDPQYKQLKQAQLDAPNT